MTNPPSTLMTCPVIYELFAKNNAASAISSTWPKRCIGICFSACSLYFSDNTSVISVVTNPGAITLHVIPRVATSLATDLVKPTTPALLAA